MGYSICMARPQHLAALAEIERQAALMFRGWEVPECVIGETTPPEDFQAAMSAGLLWVALSPQKLPIGFALVELEDDQAHLEELGVHPLHGRRGIGGALVKTVCEWAQSRGYAEISLTTYRDIPWNAPFYQRLGFEALNPSQLTPRLRERVEMEAARGLEPSRRVVMHKAL